MSRENSITVIGNLTRDPELRYTTGGIGVCNFSVAQSERKKDGNEWIDGPVSFFDCSAWRELGEHVAQSLGKGHRVIVTGSMRMRTWEDKETGKERTGWQLEVDEVGPSLKWGTTTYEKAERSSSGGGQTQSAPPAQPIYGDEEPF